MSIKSQKQEDLISILKSSTEGWDLAGNTEQVAMWNLWRMQNRHIKPCLDNVDFSGLNLSYADFREFKFSKHKFL